MGPQIIKYFNNVGVDIKYNTILATDFQSFARIPLVYFP